MIQGQSQGGRKRQEREKKKKEKKRGEEGNILLVLFKSRHVCALFIWELQLQCIKMLSCIEQPYVIVNKA